MPAETHQPLVIECTRGAIVESRHIVDAAVVDAAGQLVIAWGDAATLVYPRSGIKSVQVLPLIETGVANQLDLTDEEIAIACSSHNAQDRHLAVVRKWLKRCGLNESHLECGGHLPYDTAAAHACIREGDAGQPIHNMCSGKHSGILTTALTLGEPTAGYVHRDHPAQMRVSQAVADMSGTDLQHAPFAVDGCSIPTIGMPLSALALAAARIADPAKLPAARQAAIMRIRRAIAAHPFMIAGDGRACTRVIEATNGQALVKFGAEGVFFAALTDLGLGLALKVRDGTTRATDVALATLLDRLAVLDSDNRRDLADMLATPLRNWAGIEVGAVRAAT